MDHDHTLHPNLAQLVAARDEILERVNAGRLDWATARNQLMTLAARDDQGVQWLLGPDDGAWYRRTREGRLVRDVPPSFGVATPTAFDLSSGDPFRDPRGRVSHQAVDLDAWTDPGSLVGSTQRRPAPTPSPARRSVEGAGGLWLSAAVLVGALIVLWLLWGPR